MHFALQTTGCRVEVQLAAARIARALTGAAVIAALLAGTGFAQQRVVPPRTSPLSGRPDTEGAMRLVPPVPPGLRRGRDVERLGQLGGDALVARGSNRAPDVGERSPALQ